MLDSLQDLMQELKMGSTWCPKKTTDSDIMVEKQTILIEVPIFTRTHII